MTDSAPQARTSLLEFILALNRKQLGALAFNLGAMSYVGVNATFFGFSLPTYVPGCYVHPNLLTLISGVVLCGSTALAVIAIKRGNIFPSVLVLMFAWNILAGLIDWYHSFPLAG